MKISKCVREIWLNFRSIIYAVLTCIIIIAITVGAAVLIPIIIGLLAIFILFIFFRSNN